LLTDSEFTSQIEYWRRIYVDLMQWYSLADSKAVGILTINGILLSFVTLGSFLEMQNDSTIQNKSIVILYLPLILFLISVLVSVILAVIALWARIPFRLTPSDKIKHVQKQQDKEEKDEKNFDYPTTFFFSIADKYRPEKKNTKKTGSTYFEDEIKKYKSEEEWLKGMAREITILSWHLKEKYHLINFSFISVAVALGFMSAIVFLTMFNDVD
jgi:hypothetical protein